MIDKNQMVWSRMQNQKKNIFHIHFRSLTHQFLATVSLKLTAFANDGSSQFVCYQQIFGSGSGSIFMYVGLHFRDKMHFDVVLSEF